MRERSKKAAAEGVQTAIKALRDANEANRNPDPNANPDPNPKELHDVNDADEDDELKYLSEGEP